MGGKQIFEPVYATVLISFDGEICCEYCPLLETYSRNMCRRTGEYITDRRFTGMYCPLVEMGREEAETLIRRDMQRILRRIGGEQNESV